LQSTLSIVFAFLFGLALGSFLNVCIYRIPLKKSIVRPPSSCPNCGAGIRFYDNIPVISYVLLLGRCRHCRTPISLRYPLVELITGLLSVAIFIRFGLSPNYIFLFLFTAALIAIAFIDLQHKIIPDVISLPGILGRTGILLFPVRRNLSSRCSDRSRGRGRIPLPGGDGIRKNDRPGRNGGRRCQASCHDRRVDGLEGPAVHHPHFLLERCGDRRGFPGHQPAGGEVPHSFRAFPGSGCLGFPVLWG